MSDLIDFEKSKPHYRLIVLLAALCGCEQPTPTNSAPRPALVMLTQAQTDTTSSGFIGEVRSRYETPQGFRIPGKISQRLVDTGAVVHKGQLLAKLDGNDSQLASQAAQAQIREAQAELNLAQAELDRVQKLRDRQFVSQQALDIQLARFKTTAAKVQQIQSQARVVDNQAQYTQLLAERDGVVTDIHAEPGQVVSAGEVVVKIAAPDSKEVVVAIPESRMSGLQLGSPAQILLWVNSEHLYQGKVREIAPAADSVTRTFQVRIAFMQQDAQLRLGMTARVRLLNETPNSILLPTPAVSQRDGQNVVWVVDAHNQAQPRPVITGEFREDGILIERGLNPGEQVVIAGVHTLFPGQSVRPLIAEHPL